MEVSYDDFIDWKMRMVPSEIMDPVFDWLIANPGTAVPIKLDSGEVESVLIKINREIIRAAVNQGDGFAPFEVVRALPPQ